MCVGCKIDNDCLETQTCVNTECRDPCLDTCKAENTVCFVESHMLYCDCLPYYGGDPWTGCHKGIC